MMRPANAALAYMRANAHIGKIASTVWARIPR